MRRDTLEQTPPVVERKRESGMALLISVFVLMLVGLIAVSGIQNSEDESVSGSRTRGAVSALYQADAGVELALARIRQIPPNLDPIVYDFGDGKSVESRSRADEDPQALAFAGTGSPPEGYAIGEYYSALYQVNITAMNGVQAVAEVEAKLGTLAVGGGGH